MKFIQFCKSVKCNPNNMADVWKAITHPKFTAEMALDATEHIIEKYHEEKESETKLQMFINLTYLLDKFYKSIKPPSNKRNAYQTLQDILDELITYKKNLPVSILPSFIRVQAIGHEEYYTTNLLDKYILSTKILDTETMETIIKTITEDLVQAKQKDIHSRRPTPHAYTLSRLFTTQLIPTQHIDILLNANIGKNNEYRDILGIFRLPEGKMVPHKETPKDIDSRTEYENIINTYNKIYSKFLELIHKVSEKEKEKRNKRKTTDTPTVYKKEDNIDGKKLVFVTSIHPSEIRCQLEYTIDLNISEDGTIFFIVIIEPGNDYLSENIRKIIEKKMKKEIQEDMEYKIEKLYPTNLRQNIAFIHESIHNLMRRQILTDAQYINILNYLQTYHKKHTANKNLYHYFKADAVKDTIGYIKQELGHKIQKPIYIP